MFVTHLVDAMSNLINFDAQQGPSFDSTIVQALNNYDSNSIQAQQQQQQQQQAQAQQQQSQPQQQNNADSQFPIDPSIGDESKNDEAQLAQAAVQQSSTKAKNSQSQQDPNHQRLHRDANKVSKPRVNKPGQKFGAKKKSWVWNWFTQDPIDWNIATCSICNKPIKRLESDKGSPKKLGEHLKTHKIDRNSSIDKRNDIILNEHGNDNENGNQSNNSVESTRHFFNTINSTQSTYQRNEENSSSNQSNPQEKLLNNEKSDNNENLDDSIYNTKKFQNHVMKFLLDHKLPLSTVKSQSFRQIIHTLKPEVVADLNELNNFYPHLLEAIASGKHLDSDHVVNEVINVHVDDHGDVDVHDHNVDEQLHNGSLVGYDDIS